VPKDYVATVRIRRPRKVTTDDRGRTVWNEPVESVELELVSTTALEKILGSDDGKTRGEIRRLIKGRKGGVLAKDTATGVFQIVSDDDLKEFLESSDRPPIPHRPADCTLESVTEKTQQAAGELSLVRTQVLRKVLKSADTQGKAKPSAGKKEKFGGFDPYNNS